MSQLLLKFEKPPDLGTIEESPTVSGWFPEAKKQIEAIAALPAGWDSHGAERPDAKLLEAGLALLYCLCRGEVESKPHIHPARSGGVHLEWESGTRYFEMEVVAEDLVTYFFQDASMGLEEEGEVLEGDSLEGILAYIQQVESGAQ